MCLLCRSTMYPTTAARHRSSSDISDIGHQSMLGLSSLCGWLASQFNRFIRMRSRRGRAGTWPCFAPIPGAVRWFTSPRSRGESLPSGHDPRVDARSAAGEGASPRVSAALNSRKRPLTRAEFRFSFLPCGPLHSPSQTGVNALVASGARCAARPTIVASVALYPVSGPAYCNFPMRASPKPSNAVPSSPKQALRATPRHNQIIR